MTTELQPLLQCLAPREDFPIFGRTMSGRPLVYLDSAATSQKPAVVLDALDGYYRRHNANVHRGVYQLAEEATAAYEGARATVAGFIGASTEETIFTRNASEAINLVAYTWGRQHIKRDDVIVLTPLEHHSNLIPWQILASEVGARLEFVDLQPDGALDLGSLDRLLEAGRVKLVACTFVSNVMGSVSPIEEIARRAHLAGAVLLVDGAQAVPHLPVDVRALDLDFMAFTGHKMLGPMGIGVLYGRRSLLEDMPPFLGGGEMIRRVGLRQSTWNELPWKFEAGTPSVGDAVGLGMAIDYLENLGMDGVCGHDVALARHAAEKLSETSGVTVYGPDDRSSLVSFSVDGIHPHDLASLLDEQGIAVRAGHHCAQPLHDLLGVPATSRASFYVYNDADDVQALVNGVRQAQKVLGP